MTNRTRNADGEWIDGEPTAHNVDVYGAAAINLYDTAGQGERAIVHGLVKTATWSDRNTQPGDVPGARGVSLSGALLALVVERSAPRRGDELFSVGAHTQVTAELIGTSRARALIRARRGEKPASRSRLRHVQPPGRSTAKDLGGCLRVPRLR